METTRSHFSSALYLREDGTLLLSSGVKAIEIRLTPQQMLFLGTDCLRLALHLQPSLGEQVFDALEQTTVLIPVDESSTPPHAEPNVH
jgi:hypothetical protein